jgi:hypothetical protein
VSVTSGINATLMALTVPKWGILRRKHLRMVTHVRVSGWDEPRAAAVEELEECGASRDRGHVRVVRRWRRRATVGARHRRHLRPARPQFQPACVLVIRILKQTPLPTLVRRA